MRSLYTECVVDVEKKMMWKKKSLNVECVSLDIKMCSLLKMCPLFR